MSRYKRNIWHDSASHQYRARVMVRGRIYKRSFLYREDADEWLRMLERQDAGLPTSGPSYTLEQAEAAYLARLRERGSGSETERYYWAKWAALKEIISKDTNLRSITQAAASKYVELRRSDGIGNRTIRAELQLLWRCYRLLGMQPQWVVPELRIELKRRNAPSPDTVARLWLALDGPAKVALGLCVLTGMRASEAMRAQAPAYDSERGIITLTKRKAGDELVVAVCGTLATLLPRKGPLVAAGEWQVRAALRNASKRAGITPEWTGPGLGRHCFATWAVEAGYTTEQVADALGHTRPGLVTISYLHSQAVEPLLRPMAAKIEALLVAAIEKATPPKAKRKSPRGCTRLYPGARSA